MLLPDLLRIVLIGTGATVILDAWVAILRRMGVRTLNFAFLGRWIGHLARGRIAHDAIGASPAIPGELALGWIAHYAIGIAFAGLLAMLQGVDWMRHPSVLPALAVGIATVAAPLFVMQPAMGLGIAASKTPTPLLTCIRNLANHTVFGLGLYLSAVAIEWISR